MMNQKARTCKSQNPPEENPTAADATRASGQSSYQVDPATLPDLLAVLLAGQSIQAGLSDEDLREMAKFTELPNVEGLAAHGVARPMPPGYDPGAEGWSHGPVAVARRPELPMGVAKVLYARMRTGASVMVCGWVAGASAAPVAVQAIFPQAQAHLAAGLQRMLHPFQQDPTGERAYYTLLVWPEPLLRRNGRIMIESLIGHWPADGVGLVIGFDDPYLMAELILDAARRQWTTLGSVGLNVIQGERWPQVKGEGDQELVELQPVRSPDDVAAAKEPFVIENDEWISPVWRDPMLPAHYLVSSVWREAALNPRALPFGVEVDAAGRLPLFHARSEDSLEVQGRTEKGVVIVPREALPPPYLHLAKRLPLARA